MVDERVTINNLIRNNPHLEDDLRIIRNRFTTAYFIAAAVGFIAGASIGSLIL